ncbi:MAG TPA: protease pro-enzyme activation domain-containing protein [Mycobacteriales bacterium]|nr:protease pro-enzyme activation domain-containing protein [Mycobacteriales bacterium]
MTIGASAIVIAGFVATPVSALGASHAPTRFARVSSAPRLPAGAHKVGAASTSIKISGAVGLAPRNAAALQKAALAVSNPRSKSFRRYISRGSFAQSYGPTAATINGVEDALRSAHLKVTSVSSNGLLVHFSGSIGQAQTAFRTHIASYRLAGGRTGTATTSAVSFPASVASQVVGVTGLDTLVRPSSSLRHATKPATSPTHSNATGAAPGPVACSAATGIANEFGGLTDDQIAHAYGADGLYKTGDTGVGQTVAIYELEPFSQTDLTAFDTCYYGATKAAQMASRLSVTNVDGGPGTGEGSGESILDIDDVSGLAPGANIDVYQAPNTDSGGLDEYNKIVSDDTANVISTSWGLCEADAINGDPGSVPLENEIFEQAALQGQTVFSSSGDAGSDGCAYDAPTPATPTLSTGDPSSQPFVTSVGGTTITNASNPASEQVWNDGSAGGGGGGGISQTWGAPSWQQPFLDTAAAQTGVTNGAQACPQSGTGVLCRELPDVSAQADEYTGAITVYAAEYGGWTTFGGTSSSTPLWAAMLADIDASSGCATSSVGFATPSLYAVASIPADYTASFNDITSGNNDVYDLWAGQSYKTKTGYDMASGLGTPELTSPTGGVGLAADLCSLAAPAVRPAITSLTPTTESATTVPLTIDGTGLAGATAVSIGGYDVPTSDWSVVANSIVVTVMPTASQAGTGGIGPQDGSGHAIVSVTVPTGSDGTSAVSSIPNATSTLLYVDGTTVTPLPSVSGVLATGGPLAGGNTVTVYGSDFTGETGVTVGGMAATVTNVNSDGTKLTMTVPAYSSIGSTCASGNDPATDICQAQVVVSNTNGPSATAVIHTPYSGVPFTGISGGTPIPDCVTNATCEVVPVSSEYDYLATPAISSVTTTSAGDPTTWVSEQGTTIATIDGTGFDSLGTPWVNIGDPTIANDQDFTIDSVSPTELQVTLNGHNPTTEPFTRNLTVQSIEGLSAPSIIRYAGVPQVTSISPGAAIDTGGAAFTIQGEGFQGINNADGGELSYEYVEAPLSTDQHSGYSATSDGVISGTTPASNPGVFVATVCTVTFCSGPTSQKSFDNSLIDFFQPDNPIVTSVSTKSGPASGGTKVIIRGQNLADAVSVKFGNVPAAGFNAPELLTNGSDTEIDAVSPPGKAGSKVDITVSTVESVVQGRPSTETAAATFSYKTSVPAPARDVIAKPHGRSLAVTWKAPASNGGHAITRYIVSAISFRNSFKPGAKKPPTVVVRTKNGKARKATVAGLRAGWDYRVTVKAVNSRGHGLPGQSPKAYFIHDPA